MPPFTRSKVSWECRPRPYSPLKKSHAALQKPHSMIVSNTNVNHGAAKKQPQHPDTTSKLFVQLNCQIAELQSKLDQRDSAEQLHRSLVEVQIEALEEALTQRDRELENQAEEFQLEELEPCIAELEDELWEKENTIRRLREKLRQLHWIPSVRG